MLLVTPLSAFVTPLVALLTALCAWHETSYHAQLDAGATFAALEFGNPALRFELPDTSNGLENEGADVDCIGAVGVMYCVPPIGDD
jgi:hypothetical protein